MRGLWRIEKSLQATGLMWVAGVDEAGRGPLAGPVVAAAVMLEPGCRLPGLADSKLLTPRERERLYELILAKAISVGIGMVDARTVDRINVLQATYEAMREAIRKLDPAPALVLVDGHPLPRSPVPQRHIPHGDRCCGSIAAASVVAKVTRDRIMEELDVRYPGYGFREHKGYATAEHLARLAELGPCPEHRRSFGPVRALFQTRLSLE